MLIGSVLPLVMRYVKETIPIVEDQIRSMMAAFDISTYTNQVTVVNDSAVISPRVN